MTLRPRTTARITAEEFFALPETNLPAELIDGVVIEIPSPSIEHQRAVFRAANVVDALKPSGEVLTAPMDVHLDNHNILQPDVMWIAEGSACIPVEGKRWQGVPDLVIEVLSPGTAQRDKSSKFRLYEAHGGREYWIADLAWQLLEIWVREGDRFQLLGVYGKGETFISPVLGRKTVQVSTILGE